MSQNIYGKYADQETEVNEVVDTVNEEYYEEDLEKKHLYKEIEFAVDVEDSIVFFCK